MGVVTIRPNSNNGASGWTATGGSLHGVLADDSDSTYDASGLNPVPLQLGFPAPSIPAGAMIRLATLQLNAAYATSGAMYVPGIVRCDGDWVSFNQLVSWPSPTAVWAATLQPDQGALDIDNLSLVISSAYLARLYEVLVRVLYVAKPVATISGPSGTLTTNNRPTVTWSTQLDQHGGEQTYFRVKVFDATTYGGFGSVNPATDTPFADSGPRAGNAQSWRIDKPLPDDTYRCYVTVGQTVNGQVFWSDWVNMNHVVDVNLPGTPALSLLGEDDWARISIEVSETAGAAQTDWWEIESSSDGVSGWQDLLTTAGAGVVVNPTPGGSGSEVVGDYEPANSEVRFYRARAVRNHGNDVTVTSPWSSPVSSSWDSRWWWLKHRTLAGLNLAVSIASQPGWERPDRSGEFQGLGASTPVIVSDTVAAKRGTIAFDIHTDADRERLDLIYEQRDPVLVQKVPGGHWTDRWVRLKNHSRRPFVDKTGVDMTIDSFDWIEVPRPD